MCATHPALLESYIRIPSGHKQLTSGAPLLAVQFGCATINNVFIHRFKTGWGRSITLSSLRR